MELFGKESVYKYKRASIEDIDELVRTRIIVLIILFCCQSL